MDKHGIGIQSKHEIRHVKKQEKEKQFELEKKTAARSKLLKRGVYISIPVILVAAAFVFISSRPLTADIVSTVSADDIPKDPIHWHPALEIIINGQQQVIPSNIGLTGAHQPVHTHDSTGVLHYEINNPTPENMPLRYFFDRVWRKQFNSTCILNYCNGSSGNVKMFVNGRENFDFDNYIPKDKDQIKIEYS